MKVPGELIQIARSRVSNDWEEERIKENLIGIREKILEALQYRKRLLNDLKEIQEGKAEIKEWLKSIEEDLPMYNGSETNYTPKQWQ